MKRRFGVKGLVGAVVLVLAGTASAELTQYSFDVDGNSVVTGGGYDLPSGGAALISQNGNIIIYQASETNDRRVFRWNRETGVREQILDDATIQIRGLSLDGTELAIESADALTADDLDLWGKRGTWADIFVKDISGNLSIGSAAIEGEVRSGTISGNGRFVASVTLSLDASAGRMHGDALFLHDRNTGVTERFALPGQSLVGVVELSADGRYALVRTDTKIAATVSVDTVTKEVTTLPYAKNFALSVDGRFILFRPAGDDFYDYESVISVYDRKSGQNTVLLTKPDGEDLQGTDLAISGDGRYVVFTTSDSDLVAGDTNGKHDVYVLDRDTYDIARVSVRSDGSEFAHGSADVSISADGHYITFTNQRAGYVTENPLYGPEYCRGYTEFSTE